MITIRVKIKYQLLEKNLVIGQPQIFSVFLNNYQNMLMTLCNKIFNNRQVNFFLFLSYLDLKTVLLQKYSIEHSSFTFNLSVILKFISIFLVTYKLKYLILLAIFLTSLFN